MPTPPHRRIWIVPLLFAALIAVFGLWSDARLRQTLEDQLKAELTTTIAANATALDIWMTNQLVLASVLASEPGFREIALRVLDTPPAAPPTNDTSPRGFASRHRPTPEQEELAEALRSRLEAAGYSLAHVVSTNLTILGSTMRGRFGGAQTVLEDHVTRYSELFASGQPVIITPFKPPRPPGRGPGSRPGSGFLRPGSDSGVSPGPPQESHLRRSTGPQEDPGFPNRPPGDGSPRFRRGDLTLMQIAAPIRDDRGTVRGALSLILDPDREFTRILSVARSGRSGETYAFDPRGLLISRSRFDDHLRTLGLLPEGTNTSSALAVRLSDPGTDRPTSIAPEDPAAPVRPLTLIVSNALAGTDGVQVHPARDYRGIPVVGAWRWLPHRGFGIATQIDANEAFQPLRVLRLLFLILFLLLLLAAFSLLLASFANAAWRRRVSEAELRLKQLGQYTLEERIGEGGMGVVYRARHALLRRDTAIKLLLPDRANPDAIRRFEREVCLTCRLTHPNTIQVYDYGHTPDGIFYYAMEFLSGFNLQDLVRHHGPIPEARVVHILAQVCDALAEAHALGLVHRDIKPANVFLCHRGGIPDCVKVLDFGLVREIHRPEPPQTVEGPRTSSHPPGKANASPLDPSSTSTSVAGTPSFMPPESLQEPPASDARSDLYSLGALGYYLLTGERVFDGDTLFELCEQHLKSTPIPPSRRSSNPVSPELDAVLLRCLAKVPADRPPSASDLRRLLDGTPRSGSWTLQDRIHWWAHHSAPPSSSRSKPGEAGGDTLASPPGALPIDLQERAPAG